jgi:holliday junction DNA helicase RuvA
MIVQISGELVKIKPHCVELSLNGFRYEVWVPRSVAERIEQTRDDQGLVHLVTYYYFQMSPSSAGQPVLIGFINELERDFFLQFIKVSGIGPRAAVKALEKSISEISQAIHVGDVGFLTSLPGIGRQRAKEIVAKLQGKIGKFGLIQDQGGESSSELFHPNVRQDALDVLLQLQYKKPEAMAMIDKALKMNPGLKSSEDLLNEIYQQKTHPATAHSG